MLISLALAMFFNHGLGPADFDLLNLIVELVSI